MKFTHKSIVASLLLSVLFVFGCKEDDGPNGNGDDIPGEELSGTWEQVDANDITGPAAAEFTNFSISITATASGVTYTAESPNTDVFPTSGSFVVEESDNFITGASVTRMPDEVEVDVTVSADTTMLDMNFTIATEGESGGRYQGIDGQYSFSLTKVE